MTEWGAWMQSLGKSIIDRGVPLKAPKKVSSKSVEDGGGSGRLTGYSIVEADSIEGAVGMAKTCPHLNFGTIDVAEVMDMTM